MLEGMYSAAAGMYAQQARLDALSGDIANVNTAGYKPMRQGFRDLLYFQAGLATTNGVQLGSGSEVVDMGRGTTQGGFQDTGEPLDIGLSGPGYFQVKNQDGSLALTRNGHLQVDVQGRLSTELGQLLEPEIKLPAGADPTKVSINAQGKVAYEGKDVGQLRLVTVAAPGALQAVDENSFAPTRGSGAPQAAGTNTTVQQGVVESSGVSLSDAMTNMIEAQRAYELASKAISTQDRIAEIAIGIKR